MKKCKKCGAYISDQARLCDDCKLKRKRKAKLILALVIVVLLLVAYLLLQRTHFVFLFRR